MNKRRIARRVAWRRPTRIAHTQAEIAPNLATKVWRSTLPSLSAGGRTGQSLMVELVGIERRSVTPSGRDSGNVGVRLSAPEGACRRVVWLRLPAATFSSLTHW
jgi:hypothetical protein